MQHQRRMSSLSVEESSCSISSLLCRRPVLQSDSVLNAMSTVYQLWHVRVQPPRLSVRSATVSDAASVCAAMLRRCRCVRPPHLC